VVMLVTIQFTAFWLLISCLRLLIESAVLSERETLTVNEE
jgi:hypothetical protein